MGAEFLFMDDNARPHRANIVDENAFKSEDHHLHGLASILTGLESNRACVDSHDAWSSLDQPLPPCLRNSDSIAWMSGENIPQDQIDN
ncbi:hypothetical protein AVEN_242042-1 [Araneus ventricosus]|uniref:Tc1-like transposase DDE domain-containing protein n=1 Tax=Araneus ventricosus TaxID=182803 RepID=A0A4Y2PZF2_ARAVE|nr:hypothetical protein AVEN_242042-1 [Araneus ventricosus]